MKITEVNVHIIPYVEQKFSTQGNWRHNKDTGVLDIFISKMKDWRHKMTVLMHELKEAMWCVAHNVTSEECDAFDECYEQLYETGKAPMDSEPGEAEDCPYHIGHMLGEVQELLSVFDLGTTWKEYGDDCDAVVVDTIAEAREEGRAYFLNLLGGVHGWTPPVLDYFSFVKYSLTASILFNSELG